MSNAIKIDPRAFSRGVDEVLLLKPVRRVVVSMMHGRSAQTDRGSSTAHDKPKTSAVKIRRTEHDNSST